MAYFLMGESTSHENCATCKKAVACKEGLAYSDANPFRFGDFKEQAFDFCPYTLLHDVEFQVYYSQVWALQYGINTFGESLSVEELDGLLMLTTMRSKLVERRYAEFWSRAFGGKK